MWRLLPAAVAVELTFDVVLFVLAVRELPVNIPGSIIRFLVMGALGGLAVFRGARWARRSFAGLLFWSGAVYIYASIAPLPIIGTAARGLHFEPGVLALAVGCLLVATAATIGGRANEERLRRGAQRQVS